MFTRPMPAPKPSSRTQSGAVENPGLHGLLHIGDAGAVVDGLNGDSPFFHLGPDLSALGIGGNIDLGLVGGDADAPEERRTNTQFFEGVLELACGLSGVLQALTGNEVPER